MGNLSFKIDEQTIIDLFTDCGAVARIDWVTDKETGKFYGTAFVEFETEEGAAAAAKLNGTDILGRPVKIEFSNKAPKIVAGTTASNGKRGVRALSEKPEYCDTLFLGGLPYEMDDNDMFEFFKDCGTIAVYFSLPSSSSPCFPTMDYCVVLCRRSGI
eukprot:m.270643 g.270643  ORF g.270643 m.270643 type:complete len:158 (+) comp54765_c0_seq4:117-590(+)